VHEAPNIDDSHPPFVSTGSLPPSTQVQAWVDEALATFADDDAGALSDVYPLLAQVDADQFGICLVAADGRVYAAGDVDATCSIMSVSKPFVFAAMCDAIGADEALARIGANATGLAFNSLEAIEQHDGATNPMVNAGAIVTTSLTPGSSTDERWDFLHTTLSRFAGRTLELDEDLLASARATNVRNREIAQRLDRHGRLAMDPLEAVDLYTMQCSLRVSARDLAVMGATLADGGVNPVTGDAVVDARTCHHALAAMLTAGMYETSGEWLHRVGLPAKSGIGGGIVTVSPGKGGMGTVAPRLDEAGNSVRGQHVARYLSERLGLNLLGSQPAA